MKTWYGKFSCSSRYKQWHSSVTMNFEDAEQPKLIFATLAYAAYHGSKEEAREELAQYLLDPDDSSPFFRIGEDSDFSISWKEIKPNCYATSHEEWNGGIGLSKQDALEAYVASDAEFEEVQ